MSVAPGEAPLAAPRQPAARPARIVLEPVSQPQLGPIGVEDTLFAIGRNEAPFDGYDAALVADLSRRHARIFCEGDAVYLADLDSKNGTTVNGVTVRHTIVRLDHGAEITFGRALTFRLRLGAGAARPAGAARLASLSLRPVDDSLGLQEIVVSQFPFLISKADETFARYKGSHPHQVNYLSRRHAHIFIKGGRPFVEDLGSTNGTFVGHARLDEHAVALEDGELIAFGGRHFVYRVQAQYEAAAADPTVTRLAAPGAAPAATAATAAASAPADADKTTFVAAAVSFLDIFCVDQEPARDDEQNDDAAPAADATGGRRRRRRGKFARFAAELSGALGALGVGGADGPGGAAAGGRALRWGLPALALALALAIALALYRVGAPERDVRALLAGGDYARAAALAGAALADDPDNPALQSLGAEALLKARVPAWLALLKARQFAAAAALAEGIRQSSRHNPELRAVAAELAWISGLEQFVNARGGAQAPSASAADAAHIKLILAQWEEDSEAHQRAFATISAQVPAYRDAYAEALSHVRKLALSGGRAADESANSP